MMIEIIGLPGSGKSTLLRMLSNSNFECREYKTWEQIKSNAIYLFIKSEISELRKFINLPWKVLWHMPVMKNYFADYLLHKRIKFSPFIYECKWGITAGIVTKGILERPILSEEMKPHYIGWELEKIARARLTKYFSEKTHSHILLDEGILTTISTLDIEEHFYSTLDNSILPDAVIYLNTNPELVYTETLIRKKNNRLLQLKDKSNEEIMDFIINKQKKYEQIIKQVKDKGIPIIEFDRESDSITQVVNQLTDLVN